MIPLFDAHCDTITALAFKEQGLLKNRLHLDLGRAAGYSPYAQFFAIWCDSMGKDTLSMFEAMRGHFADFQRELDKNQDKITLCRTAQDAKDAAQSGKAAAFFSLEGCEQLGGDVLLLRAAYDELALRMVTLTWNYENSLSGSNADGESRGLSESGRAFVRECERLGVIVDVSHLSDPGFRDVAEILDGPFVASHSNSRAHFPSRRNLTDEQFLELCRHGGVAGINLYAGFISGRRPCPLLDLTAHIEHFCALGGEKSVALGCDLDGCDTLPEGIGGIEDVHRLYDALLRLNYPEDTLRGIFYNNMMRVVEKVCNI